MGAHQGRWRVGAGGLGGQELSWEQSFPQFVLGSLARRVDLASLADEEGTVLAWHSPQVPVAGMERWGWGELSASCRVC